MRHTFVMPRRYQEFPGEVIGLSFPLSSHSSSVIIYSARYILTRVFIFNLLLFLFNFYERSVNFDEIFLIDLIILFEILMFRFML